jgi:hypothetical protein
MPFTPPTQGASPISDGTTFTQLLHVDATGDAHFTDGGSFSTPIAAGVTTDTVIKPSAGRLCKVLITATGTNPMSIFDNASGHTGTIIGQFPANPVVGSIVSFQMPAANGITVQGNAANPGFTVSFD